MKNIILFLLTSLFFSHIVFSQTPAEVLYSKYSEKNGIGSSMITKPIMDSITNQEGVMTLKVLNVANEEDNSKLFKKFVRECEKMLEIKDYLLAYSYKDSDGESLIKAFKLRRKGILEYVVFDIDEDEVILTIFLYSGLSENAMNNIKFDYKIN